MFNYDDIGGKIKSLAKWTFIVEAVSAVISGLAVLINGNGWGILIAVCGPIVAWVGSWVLYGFGQLIENTTPQEDTEKVIITETVSETSSDNGSTQTTTTRITTKTDDKDYLWATCPHCEREFSYHKSMKVSQCPLCGRSV